MLPSSGGPPALHAVPAPERRLPPFPTAPLPSPLTSLVGRERQIGEIQALLRPPEVRLLTLTGAGGVGKTRLAIRVACEAADDFPGGVAFVDLTAIRDPALVVPTIGHALGVADTANDALVTRLHDAGRGGRLLLVLDNLEQVVAAGPALAALLAGCPGLTILATSREVLRLSGEQEVQVPPLQAEAVELFVARAGGVRPGFALTDANAGPIGAICARLDGLPLAIELAATRLRHLSPEALLARLDDRLILLTGGPRDQPARLRTLRDAITWSHDLLDTDERALFRRLSVFAGGFSLEGAAAVASEEWEVGSEKDDHSSPHSSLPTPHLVFDGIASLIDKSLLTRSDEAADGESARGHPEPRFVMLETIRDFGLEQLAVSGDSETTRRHHARWCLALAEQAVAEFGSAAHACWLRRLDREHPNLRQALTFAADRGDAPLGHRLVAALWRFWEAQGFLGEGSVWAERLLALGRSDETIARASALSGAAMLTFRQGHYPSANALAEESLALARRLGAPDVAAEAVTALGNVAFVRGQNATALAHYEEAVNWRRAAAAADALLDGLTKLGLALTVAEDLDRAETILGEALALSRARRCPYWEAISLVRHGLLAHRRGNLDVATDHYDAALALLGDGNALAVAGVLWDAAAVARDRGELPTAAGYLQASLARRWNWLERRGIAETLAAVAELAVLTGRHEPATRLFGAAEELRRAIGVLDDWYHQPRRAAARATARRALGEATGATVFAAGQRLPLAEAVELATTVAGAIRADPVTPASPPPHGLTSRELDVLHLVATGQSDREIGDGLFISPRTVSRHLQSIYAKLDVNSRTAASAFAHRHGLA